MWTRLVAASLLAMLVDAAFAGMSQKIDRLLAFDERRSVVVGESPTERLGDGDSVVEEDLPTVGSAGLSGGGSIEKWSAGEMAL